MNSGTLIKISDNKNDLRTNEVYGDFPYFPQKGNSFVIFGEPMTEGANVRIVETSMVMEVKEIDLGYEFKTYSGSVYKLMPEMLMGGLPDDTYLCI